MDDYLNKKWNIMALLKLNYGIKNTHVYMYWKKLTFGKGQSLLCVFIVNEKK